MPADFGITDMLRAEYDRFARGIADLSDGGQERARQAAARTRPGAPETRTVQIPAWDDVVHLTPAPTITSEQREAHYAARRAGKASPLSDPLILELERKGRRARRMNEQASPEWAKAYGQVMTSIDNVQDFLTTVTTVGRLILNPAVRATNLLAPTFGQGALREAEFLYKRGIITPAQMAAERRIGVGLGARTIGRVIPGLGVPFLIADLLKLVNTIGMMLFPFYAALCAGIPAGAAAAVPSLLFGAKLKLRPSQLARNNPFAMKARLSRANTLRSWKPSVFNLMEVAQTTDQLFGVGISFGGLVGAVQDGAFAAEQWARGKPVKIDSRPFAEGMHRILAPTIRELPTPELHDGRAAANALTGAATMARTNDDFDLEEHAEALAAASAALSFLQPIISDPRMEIAVNAALEYDIPPPRYQVERTAAVLEGEGIRGAPFDRWPLPGNPSHVKGAELLELVARDAPPALERLMRANGDGIGGTFVGAVASKIGERAAYLLTGSRDGFSYELQPEWQIAESLLEAGRWLVGADGEGKIGAFFAAGASELDRKNQRKLYADDLDRIATATGARLIRVASPDTPYPTWLAPDVDTSSS